MGNRRKSKTYAWMPRNENLRKLMASPAGIIMINWAFQGILGMDPTDRWYKIGFDVVVTLCIVPIINHVSSWWLAVILSIILAHTLNWLLNGNFFDIGRDVGFTSTPVDRIWSYTQRIANRVQNSPAMLGAAVYGAVTRGEGLRTSSDVDMRFIRRPGWRNGWRAAWFTFLERARAFFAGFPLDLYLLDDLRKLGKMRGDEKPILLHDPDGVLQAYYTERGYCGLHEGQVKQ